MYSRNKSATLESTLALEKTMFEAAGSLILLADIWAVTRTLRSTAPPKLKITWVAIILLLPFVGIVAWIILGPS